MNRRSSSFRSLAVAATADSTTSSAAMSSRPYLRGGRPHGRRGYSDRPLGPASGDQTELVSGDSHFRAVRETNRGFRPSYNAVPPPPQYVTGQQFYEPGSQSHRTGPPVFQHFPGPRPYRHPQQVGPALGNYQQFRPQQMPQQFRHSRQVGPAFGNYQQFRPQQMPQQFRPRASKPPDYREWEYAKQGLPPHCERFTVLSYNVLADYLATDHWQKLYFHIPGYIMDWNWRRRNISFELGLWSADILCFQEVDRFQDIEAELKPRGYTGIWKMRTGDPADGCAIFWRLSRFKLLHEESIEYNKLGLRDNVAQICVFESLNGQSNNSNPASTMSTSGSSASSNRVVVCNIHVLFNPKRGDVKLGQIRVLLDRAHAVSKLWDDAPVVICGDFNCTPKSPMYNFITEQKLDLSKLPRDKVSGQTSAEIRPSWPAYPDFRRQAADNSTQASAVNCEKIEHRDMPSDAQYLARLHSSTDAPSTGKYSKPECSVVDETPESCIGEEHRSRRTNDFPSHDTADSCAIKSVSTSHAPLDVFSGSLNSALALDDIESPICPARDTNEIAFLESSCENIPANSTEVRECVESNLQTLSDNHSSDLAKTSEPTLTSNSDTSQLEGPSEKLSPNSLDVASSKHEAVTLSVSDADDNHDKPSYESSLCESTGADFVLDEKFEHLSLNELVDGATDKLSEDCDSFLSELHSTGQSSLHSHDDGILNDTLYVERPSPSAWTPAEIETATGSADHKVVEHPLKLTSSYAEVENSSGLRDYSGEPFITSYHRLFSGTVDYIWHSEGLQTVKILAPIPKHVMQQTRGFPTKKWGSDHIALVSEFGFTKDSSCENASQ